MDASPSLANEPSLDEPARVQITPLPDDDWDRRTAAFLYSSPDGWTASGTVTRTRRRGVIISELTFHGGAEDEGEPGPVTSSALRQLPTGDIIATAMRSDALPPYEHAVEPVPREEKRQPGRQPLTDELLVEVATRYLAETGPSKPRGAVQRLAEQMGKPPATISRWLMRARADGWLGPAVPGREGGEAGPRLISLEHFAQQYDADPPAE